jgi:hypothetical protein
MSDQQQKRRTTTGYFFTGLGVYGVVTCIFFDPTWTTGVFLKLCISVVALGYGLWSVFRKG